MKTFGRHGKLWIISRIMMLTVAIAHLAFSISRKPQRHEKDTYYAELSRYYDLAMQAFDSKNMELASMYMEKRDRIIKEKEQTK